MGNLFGEIGKRATDLVSYPISASKDLITDPKKGIDKFKNLYTHNTHKDQDLFQKGFGIKGWVGDHPQESAAAVVGTIFGGWMAAPAAGGAAGGTAAGAGGTAAAGTAGTAAGTGAGALGGVGASAYMAPAAAGGVGTSSGAMATGLGATGGSTFTPALLTSQGAAAAGGSGAASAGAGTGATAGLGNTSALLQMGHLGAAGQGMGSGVGAAGTGFSTSSLSASGAQSAMAAGGDYGVSSPLLTTSQAPSGASTAGGNSVQWDRLSKTLNSVKQSNESNQPQAGSPQMAPAYRAQFSPSKGNQNELLTKTMQDIYSQPMYAPLSISR